MRRTHYLHPGEILKEDFLADYDLSVSSAAKAMGLARTRLNDIVRGRRGITAETALCLGVFFGNGPEFWLNLQNHYDIAKTKAVSKERLKKIRTADEIMHHAIA